MKTKMEKSKLQINKVTIAKLNHALMTKVVGGKSAPCPCWWTVDSCDSEIECRTMTTHCC